MAATASNFPETLTSGRRGALYGSLAGTSAALLGFVLAALSILIALPSSERMDALRDHPKWERVPSSYFRGEEGVIKVTERGIRYVKPSDIQDDPDLRVVFFKMSLTTGWDCPRAEVMMSYRSARDDTLIAQLVGRMVRTPLARAVSGSDLLNTVPAVLRRKRRLEALTQ